MASIKDVAELAGVSLSTASIVANGKAIERKISEKTQKKVLQSMQELNYIPNVSAKTLRKGESQKYIVALFWNFDFRGIMMHRFLFGIQKRIKEMDVNMSIIVYPYETGNLRNEHMSFQGSQFHAAIIANANADDLDYLEKNNFQVPIVLYNRSLPGFCSVNVDDRKLGSMAAGHLFDQGYRHPAIIHGSQSFAGATKRDEGFCNRMEEYGIHISEDHIFHTDSSLRGGYDFGKMLLKDIEKGIAVPDSYFCSTDSIAMGLLSAISDASLVPDKIGVIAVGNNDPQFAFYNSPSLTVINMPIEEMAEECCQFLIDRMYTIQMEPSQKYFDTELYARTSTALTN